MLEIGSGIGNLSAFLLDAERLVLTDTREEYLDRLRARFAQQSNVAVARLYLPAELGALAGQQFDTIICLNVLEHVDDDAASLQAMRRMLAPAGRLVTCGATTGSDAQVDLRYLFSKQWSLLGSFMGTMGELHQVLKFVFRKQLRPVVDRVFPLQEIRAAHTHLDSGEHFGKVIVQCA